MEKIKVLKSNAIEFGFNINVFVDILIHFDELVPGISISSADAWANAEMLQSLISDKQLFNFNAKDIFIIRQLLTTGYFAVDQNEEFNREKSSIENINSALLVPKIKKEQQPKIDDTIKIRIDRITLGTHYNIPANKDIEVKNIVSVPEYNFRIDQSTDGLKRLLNQSKQLYEMKLIYDFIDRVAKKAPQKLQLPNIAELSNGISNNFINIGELNNYLLKSYLIKPAVSLCVFVEQLKSSGNIEILRELIYGKYDDISRFLYTDEKRKLYKKQKVENIKAMYDSFNMFNRLYNIMTLSPKSYTSILEKIKINQIKTIDRLRNFISKDEYNKISKLLEITIKPANDCTHNRDFRKFHAARTKDEFYEQYEALKNEYIKFDETNHVYRCKKCSDFLFCEHDIDFANAATNGMGIPSSIKEKLSEKYRDTTINDPNGTIFCKYCNSKLYRMQNDEIIDGSIFNALSHARSLDSNNTTELPIAKNETFMAIKRVLGDFIFKYEFNQGSLIRNIQKIILIHVLTNLANMKITATDDNFEIYAQMIGSIYAYVYMYDLYAKDKNIILRNQDTNNKLNVNQYAKFFADKISHQYNKIISDNKRLEVMVTNAYITMKSEMRSFVDEITETDHVMAILCNPYYKYLYYLFSIERSAEGKPKLNEVEAFPHIVKVQKPTLFNFWHGSYAPKSAIWKQEGYKILAESYDLLLNMSSPYNYFQIPIKYETALYPFYGYEKKEYDPLISDKMRKFNKMDIYNIRRTTYLDMGVDQKPREIFRAVPACYVYDNSLKPYKWEPLIEKGKLVDFASGDVLISKLKCDQTISDSLINKLSPDKCNTVYGKATMINDLVTYDKSKSKQRDIQFSIIKKLNSGFNINQLKFIGQSSGVTSIEFMKGNVAIPVQYEICSMRLKYYIYYLIKKYNFLRYNTNHTDNLGYFERTNLLHKISTYNESKFPDIDTDSFNNYKYNSMQDLYEESQEYLVKVIKTLLDSNDQVIRLFIIDEISNILYIDKLYCKGNDNAIGDMSTEDDDAVGNADQAQVIDIDKNDDDYIDVDNIDYDMDEDEIHDNSD